MFRLFFIFLATTFLFACNNSSTSNDTAAADESSSAAEASDSKPFHSTDALLIGGNGGFNPSAEDGGADLELSPEIK
jgi:hypothetical protein